jgi:hypothetical protein
MTMNDEYQWDGWPNETVFSPAGSNTTLAEIAAVTDFGEYIDTSIVNPFSNNIYTYDSDGDLFDQTACLSTHSLSEVFKGAAFTTSLGVADSAIENAQTIHDLLDSDGDYLCGKVAAYEHPNGTSYLRIQLGGDF